MHMVEYYNATLQVEFWPNKVTLQLTTQLPFQHYTKMTDLNNELSFSVLPYTLVIGKLANSPMEGSTTQEYRQIKVNKGCVPWKKLQDRVWGMFTMMTALHMLPFLEKTHIASDSTA